MINFRKKIKKNEENSSKAKQGSKTKETEHCISRCEIFARWKSRCEFHSKRGAIFAHLRNKVRNLPQGAKTDFKVRNSLKAIFAHHCSRCENFRTVRNPLLAHECHFRTSQANFRIVRNKVRNFRTVQNWVRNAKQGANSSVRSMEISHDAIQGAKFSVQGAKISHGQIQGVKIFARSNSRCENFCTVKF